MQLPCGESAPTARRAYFRLHGPPVPGRLSRACRPIVRPRSRPGASSLPECCPYRQFQGFYPGPTAAAYPTGAAAPQPPTGPSVAVHGFRVTAPGPHREARPVTVTPVTGTPPGPQARLARRTPRACRLPLLRHRRRRRRRTRGGSGAQSTVRCLVSSHRRTRRGH